jgi:apoptotic chromatin condensation inducer in the nucleus
MRAAWPFKCSGAGGARPDDERVPRPPTVVPPPNMTPTAALRVDNLVRPFTLQALRALLSETGTVTGLWMPSIKTHCYVTFETAEQAEATR